MRQYRGATHITTMSGLKGMPALWRAVRPLEHARMRMDAAPLLVRHMSSKGQRDRLTSTSALDHKLSHRHRKLPPLPSLDRPVMEAGEAVSNILYNTPPPSTQPLKR